MKTIRNTLLVSTAVMLMLIGDAPPESRFGFQLMQDAHAILGVWRRHARRWAVVGTTAAVATTATVAAADEAAAAGAQQQAAADQQQAASAPPQPAAAPPAASSDKPLPLGTVVSSLPAGCESTPVGGVNYYYCGGNFYRATFQGNNLVYVTAKP